MQCRGYVSLRDVKGCLWDESGSVLFQGAQKKAQRTSVLMAETETVFFSSTLHFTTEPNFHNSTL
jgi:hypothetical protein